MSQSHLLVLKAESLSTEPQAVQIVTVSIALTGIESWPGHYVQKVCHRVSIALTGIERMTIGNLLLGGSTGLNRTYWY